MSPSRKKAPAAKAAAPKPSPFGRTGALALGLEELKSLIGLVAAENIHEFEFETGSVRFRIRKDGAGIPVVGHAPASALHPPAPALAPPPAPAPVSAPTPAAIEDDPAIHFVTSPIVGTFYRSPSPTSPAFADVGDFVKPGQTLCIVEAMKLMNEIESEVAGEVVKVLVENGQPVEYGERIFAIRVG
ncbi:MAG: acetyl-CoA carboxylase biotin carboxyl carrier protein [Acidobacteria bacterium]|nr:acetyl-CoA carboxylase biotin carboxyl carrier protein [Acidobacteriota bacterium]